MRHKVSCDGDVRICNLHDLPSGAYFRYIDPTMSRFGVCLKAYDGFGYKAVCLSDPHVTWTFSGSYSRGVGDCLVEWIKGRTITIEVSEEDK